MRSKCRRESKSERTLGHFGSRSQNKNPADYHNAYSRKWYREMEAQGVYQTMNQCWERANLGHGPRGTNTQCLVQKFWS